MSSTTFQEVATLLVREDILHEGGPSTRVLRRVASIAIVNNPFAGRYVKDIAFAMDLLKELGKTMAETLVAEIGGPDQVEGYGKGAIVGEDGEIEHGALWHVPGGYAMREALGNALAMVPSTKKVGAPGATLDIPITHRDASYVRSHFDAMEVSVKGSPAADEILLVLAMTDGPRIHERVGGLRSDQITRMDGLR